MLDAAARRARRALSGRLRRLRGARSIGVRRLPRRAARSAPIDRRWRAGCACVSARALRGRRARPRARLKEGGRTDAAPTLAAALAPLLASASDLALVPQSAEAARRRGYDPVRLLVRRAGYRCPPVLRRASRDRGPEVASISTAALPIGTARCVARGAPDGPPLRARRRRRDHRRDPRRGEASDCRGRRSRGFLGNARGDSAPVWEFSVSSLDVHSED